MDPPKNPAFPERPVAPELKRAPGIFKPAELAGFISTNLTLPPGDVILTGTPSGIGPIQSGDKLEVRIQGIGAAEQHGEVRESWQPVILM